ncbi:MAG: hypothetical protein K8R89_09850 [Anaerolineae bacterium]|nr:hypothetical protein [Anaerolineae bacterium]
MNINASNPLPPDQSPSTEQGVVGTILMLGPLAGYIPGLVTKTGTALCIDGDCTNEVESIGNVLCRDGNCINEAESLTNSICTNGQCTDTAGSIIENNSVRDAALGINDNGQIFGFARQTNAYWYGEWQEVGLTDGYASSFDFGSSFEQAMNRAGGIHFSLDGIIGNPIEFAELGGTGNWGSVPWSARELYLIWQNSEWLAKTIFYQNGQTVPSPFGQ